MQIDALAPISSGDGWRWCRGHVPLTFYKFVCKVPLFSLREYPVLLLRELLNACAPHFLNTSYALWQSLDWVACNNLASKKKPCLAGPPC